MIYFMIRKLSLNYIDCLTKCFYEWLSDCRYPNEWKIEISLYILYYSSHRGEGSGNWIFTDNAVSFNKVYDLWCQSGKSATAKL